MNNLLNKKIIVLGTGFLGGYVLDKLKINQISSEGTNYQNLSNTIKLNATNIEEVEKYLISVKPETVINCVGIGDIDFLEKNPKIAYKINSDTAKNIAKICNKLGIYMIHISTDSVFDGQKGMYKENDKVNPLNIYAKSKVLAENYVQENAKNSLIVRTNFYGFDKKTKWFFNWITNSLSSGKKITGFNDLIFNPLAISNLSDLLIELTTIKHEGILHLSSNDTLSKYDFIMNVAEIFEFDKNLIEKGNSSLLVQRPKNTTLDNALSIFFLKTPIIPLDLCLKNIKKKFF
jgi:dTDP-4-dehydrorhamnose reductase